MTLPERSLRDLELALRGADNLLKDLDGGIFGIKADDQHVVALDARGETLMRSDLGRAPDNFQQAWGRIEKEWLVRVAVYYRLWLRQAFSDDAGAEVADSPEAWRPRRWREILSLGIYETAETESGTAVDAGFAKPDEAFALAVEVFTRRLAEVAPKEAARLRRAIKAGLLNLEPTGIFYEAPEWWVRLDQMGIPERWRFHDDNFNQSQPHDVRSEASGDKDFATMGINIGRSLGYSVLEAFTSGDLDSHDDRAADFWDRLASAAKPVVNVYGLSSFTELVLVCVLGLLAVTAILHVMHLFHLV